MIPAVDEIDNQPRNAFPVDVAANQQQPMFVEYHVPQGAAAGWYAGTVHVTGGVTADVPGQALRARLHAAVDVEPAVGVRHRLERPLHRALRRLRAVRRRRRRAGPQQQVHPLRARPSHLAVRRRSTTARRQNSDGSYDWATWDAIYGADARRRHGRPARRRQADRRCATCGRSIRRTTPSGPSTSAPRAGSIARSTTAATSRRTAARGRRSTRAPRWSTPAIPASRRWSRPRYAAGARRTACSPASTCSCRCVDCARPDAAGHQRAPRRTTPWLADVAAEASCGCTSRATPTAATASAARSQSGWPTHMIDAPATQNRAMEWQAWRQQVAGELYYDTTYAFPAGDAWTQPVLLRRQRRRHPLLPGHAGKDRRHLAHPDRQPAPEAHPRGHGGLRVPEGARRRRRPGDGRRRGRGAVARRRTRTCRTRRRSTPRATASRCASSSSPGRRRRRWAGRAAARAAQNGGSSDGSGSGIGGNGATSGDTGSAGSTDATPTPAAGSHSGCSFAGGSRPNVTPVSLALAALALLLVVRRRQRAQAVRVRR